MKKVANCFMSLGSVSRARAMFNSVMTSSREFDSGAQECHRSRQRTDSTEEYNGVFP